MNIDAVVEETLRSIPTPEDRERFAIHLQVLAQMESSKFVEGEVWLAQRLRAAGLLILVQGTRDSYSAADRFACWLRGREFSLKTDSFVPK